MKKKFAGFLALLVLLGTFCGCAKQEEKQLYPKTPEELDRADCSIGVGSGTAAQHDAESYFRKANVVDYSTDDDGYLAVQMGKLDAFAASRMSMEFAVASGGLRGVSILKQSIGEQTDVVVGVSRKSEIPNLREKVNSFIAQIYADGTIEKAREYWITEAGQTMPEITAPEHPEGTLRVGTCALIAPFVFYADGELVGLDAELMNRFAAYLNRKIEIVDVDFAGLVAAAESGTVDCIFADLFATPERAEVMDFSDPIYTTDTALLVRSEDIEARPVIAYDGKRLGVVTGGIHEQIAAKVLPNAIIQYYNGFGDMIAALNSDVIDAFFYPRSAVDQVLKVNPGLTALDEPVGYADCGIAFGKSESGQKLCSQMNEFLSAIKESGEIDEMSEYWRGDDVEPVDMTGLDSGERILTFATGMDTVPYCYILDNQPAGYEVDLAARFCRAYGYGLNIETVSFSGVIQGLVSGMYDFSASGIIITEERAESVLFSQPDLSVEISLVVNKAGTAETAQESFWDGVGKSFEKTFIREQRWKLIVQGIGTTLFISFFSAVFGTALGFALCLLRKKHEPVSYRISTVFIRIMQGTPLVVMLMVLYYLVFAKTALTGQWVAIIAFSLNFAAYVSEIMRTGIESIEIGQTEAALALGFTRQRTFTKFIFPQAIQNFLPVYKGELISLVKSTSIVGYIAVQDLTKMSDIIRSRTYEAFFPLISTALIYFLLSAALGYLLRMVEIRVEPDRKNRTVKGVVMK